MDELTTFAFSAFFKTINCAMLKLLGIEMIIRKNFNHIITFDRKQEAEEEEEEIFISFLFFLLLMTEDFLLVLKSKPMEMSLSFFIRNAMCQQRNRIV